MFGWLKKKKEPAETETAKFFKKLDEVRGQYMEKRFFPVIEGHLELLRENLQNVLDRPAELPSWALSGGPHPIPTIDGPPFAQSRWYFAIFRGHVDELSPKMMDELVEVMAEWLKQADAWGGRDDIINRLFQHRVDSYLETLLMAGLKVMTDYADRLKEADDAWRKANPEKAKEYPDPTDDPWSAARREGRFVP